MGEIYSSSGSEYEPDSVCLQEMVHAFMHEKEQLTRAGSSFEREKTMRTEADQDHKAAIAHSQKQKELKVIIMAGTSEEELGLLAEITKSMEMEGIQHNDVCLQRSVMKYLRNRGYDAAICKSQLHLKPNKTFPTGKYEYMDVIMNTHNNIRVMVDIDFRAQFEIARPTKEYAAILELLPPVYVGNSERLLQIVKIMSECVKVSLKAQGMEVPPWRKGTYMLSKWLGSYKRTINSASLAEETNIRKITPFHSYMKQW